jgi:hypothetical protein
LHVYFAEQYLADMDAAEETKWGGNFTRACRESLVWQLLLAYQCHVADLLAQQPKFGLNVPSGVFTAGDIAGTELPPEIIELIDREQQAGWLSSLVKYPFLQATVIPAIDVIAFDGGQANRVLIDYRNCLSELKSLIARHRATLMEY